MGNGHQDPKEALKGSEMSMLGQLSTIIPNREDVYLKQSNFDHVISPSNLVCMARNARSRYVLDLQD